MNYESTLSEVRLLSETATTNPLKRQVPIAPFQPVPLQIPKRSSAPTEDRVTRLEFPEQDRNRAAFEDSRIRGRTFTHRVTGKVAYYGGRDASHRSILDTSANRYYVTETELQLWWRADVETDNAA